MAYHVYILASQQNGTLYIGMTKDLIRRIHVHKEGLVDSFTKRHCMKTLVYFESHDRTEHAIQREKTLKHWGTIIGDSIYFWTIIGDSIYFR
jgi:putative endonuclease